MHAHRVRAGVEEPSDSAKATAAVINQAEHHVTLLLAVKSFAGQGARNAIRRAGPEVDSKVGEPRTSGT